MNSGSNCDPTITTKVTIGLNENDGHIIVTSKVGKKCAIDNNIKRTRFVYNSKVNPTCIEDPMAKQSRRGRSVKCNKNVIHVRVFVASDNLVHVSNSNKCYAKLNVNPVNGVNASCTNVLTVTLT